MIPIKKLSPSSINTLDMCELKWVLQYAMNYREPSGKSAAIGTICHYVLECVAKAKKLRMAGRKYQQDKIVGRIKENYDISELIDKSYQHFVKKESHLTWEDADFRQVCRNIDVAKNHKLFPENHAEIIQTEYFFNAPISPQWGDYSYINGKKVDQGKVHITGLVDLVFRDCDGVLNILDYKFGKPTDWVSGKEKDYFGFIKDVQLSIYYHVMKQKFPNEPIIANLWYVKAKQLFFDFFSHEQEELALKKLQSSLQKIRSIQNPKPNYSFKCGFCSFKKTNFADWGRPELDMDYNKVGGECKFDAVDGKACVCDASRIFFERRGLDTTIEKGKK